MYRLLLLYPADFRRRYGDDMVRLLIARLRHDERRAALGLLDETFDAVRTAPRMRWESPMNRTVIIAVAGTVAIVAALVAQLLLVPPSRCSGRLAPMGTTAAAICLAFIIASLDAVDARRCTRDPVAVAIPTIDGGELNEIWWTVATVALLGGIAMAITAVALAASARAHRLASPH